MRANIRFCTLWLIVGVVVGAAATTGFFLLIDQPSPPASLSVREAQSYVSYYCKAKTDPCAMLAVDIDRGQFEAMTWIEDEYGSAVKGFRLYVGMGDDNTRLAVIRPLNADGTELGEQYYYAPGPLFSGCPVVCDQMQPTLELCYQ